MEDSRSHAHVAPTPHAPVLQAPNVSILAGSNLDEGGGFMMLAPDGLSCDMNLTDLEARGILGS